MSDADLKEYARLENNHILGQLVGIHPATGEDPVALAERNCRATEESFGPATTLHAMARNTYAFALIYKRADGAAALPHALAAIEILDGLPGEWEMLLEARMLAAQARMMTDVPPSRAVIESFEPAGSTGAQDMENTAIARISRILADAVRGRRLERPVLQMSLRQVAERLHGETSSDALFTRLVDYLEAYFKREQGAGR